MTPMLYYMGTIGLLVVLIACISVEAIPGGCRGCHDDAPESREKRNSQAVGADTEHQGGAQKQQIAVDTEETLFGPERAARNQTAHRHPRSADSEEIDDVPELTEEFKTG
ncbi:uncharacterized protein LOC129598912 [Paramacrobiotus metropolitanus]|uniref:uncharacterized protein LOC129598912 n=1 Tax=Paramacrobiotus metropolitanus TaxID=2943436 RepID=UPI00244629A6|nr:uncharacterized protein LOC129598912 [Paramacrobiotus metropolitanus]